MKDGRTPELRRMMVEYGEQFWRSGWAPLYGVLGGNPLAAMPSLHFATSVTAAHVLAETGTGAGLLGWAYTALLGTALVYLGEHYVVDLMAGRGPAAGGGGGRGGPRGRARGGVAGPPRVGAGAGDRGPSARMTDASSAPVTSPNA